MASASAVVPSASSPRSASMRRLVGVERLEAEQRRAAAQRRVDLEERVLRRRPDEHERAVLDGRQQGVLLRLVEAVDLVEEQDRALVVLAEALAGPLDHLADVLDAGGHGRQLLERPSTSCRRRPARASSCRCPAVPTAAPTTVVSGSTRRRSGRPGPSRCGWPTTSSIVRGRSRAASGAWVRRRSAAARRTGRQPAHGRAPGSYAGRRNGDDVVDQPAAARPTARPELAAVGPRFDVVVDDPEREPPLHLADAACRPARTSAGHS